ncbi:unnamed protein product, partial [Rotaria sp. Silwood2]
KTDSINGRLILLPAKPNAVLLNVLVESKLFMAIRPLTLSFRFRNSCPRNTINSD